MTIADSDRLDQLAQVWQWFGNDASPTSPIYGAICEAVATDRELLGLVLETPPEAHLPPLLLTAVHYLLLADPDQPLRAVYAGRSDADPAPLFRDICLDRRDEIQQLMRTRRIQTNEVRRSTLIAPCLSWAADRYGEPVALVDVGCSAGLNLYCDRYLLDYGDRGTTGPPDSAIRLSCRVTGGEPPIRSELPPIVHRIGVDLEPPDLTDPADVRWLLACVWPGTGRFGHTERAIAAAQPQPPPVVAGDAIALLPQLLRDVPAEAGLVCVLTTWAFSYFSSADRDRFIGILTEVADRRPLVWLAGDVLGSVPLDVLPPAAAGTPLSGHVMTAGTWEGGVLSTSLLAKVQHHGEWLDWLT